MLNPRNLAATLQFMAEHTVNTSACWLLPTVYNNLCSDPLRSLAACTSFCRECVLLLQADLAWNSVWSYEESHVLRKSVWRENREGDVTWTNTLWMKPFPNAFPSNESNFYTHTCLADEWALLYHVRQLLI